MSCKDFCDNCLDWAECEETVLTFFEGVFFCSDDCRIGYLLQARNEEIDRRAREILNRARQSYGNNN